MIRRLLTWWWKVRRPKWRDIGDFDPLSSITHGKHHIELVSRHSIAEEGLMCPACGNEVAPRGVFKLVQQCRMGEVIHCTGQREANDSVMECGKFLIASPDTEHGDDILWDKTPPKQRHKLFHSFRRRAMADVLKDIYGDDISQGSDSVLLADAAKTVVADDAKPKDTFAFVAGDCYHTSDGLVAKVLRVNDNGDKFYQGWAYVAFTQEDDQGWLTDRQGVVHLEMRDPTGRRSVRLTSKIQNV